MGCLKYGYESAKKLTDETDCPHRSVKSLIAGILHTKQTRTHPHPNRLILAMNSAPQIPPLHPCEAHLHRPRRSVLFLFDGFLCDRLVFGRLVDGLFNRLFLDGFFLDGLLFNRFFLNRFFFDWFLFDGLFFNRLFFDRFLIVIGRIVPTARPLVPLLDDVRSLQAISHRSLIRYKTRHLPFPRWHKPYCRYASPEFR